MKLMRTGWLLALGAAGAGAVAQPATPQFWHAVASAEERTTVQLIRDFRTDSTPLNAEAAYHRLRGRSDYVTREQFSPLLTSADPQARFLGALFLADIFHDRSLEVRQILLRDTQSRWTGWTAALEFLQDGASIPEGLRPSLDEAFASDNPARRFLAAVVLTRAEGHTPEWDEELIANFATDTTLGNASAARRALGEGDLSAQTFDRLCAALYDPDRQIRFEAAVLLAERYPAHALPQAAEVLIENLAADEVQGNAGRAWQTLRDLLVREPDLAGILDEAMDSPDPVIRSDAARLLIPAIRQDRIARLMSVMMEAQVDGEWSNDHWNLEDLPRPIPSDTIAVLEDHLGEENEAGEEAFDLLTGFASEPDSGYAPSAGLVARHIDGLRGKRGSLRSYEFFFEFPDLGTQDLERTLHSEDERQRVRAAVILARTGRVSSPGLLAQILVPELVSDSIEYNAITAAQALCAIGRPAIPYLRDLVDYPEAQTSSTARLILLDIQRPPRTSVEFEGRRIMHRLGSDWDDPVMDGPSEMPYAHDRE